MDKPYRAKLMHFFGRREEDNRVMYHPQIKINGQWYSILDSNSPTGFLEYKDEDTALEIAWRHYCKQIPAQPIYKPEVPQWVADILRKEREGNPHPYIGYTKDWEAWKRSYSRKLKYARLNGWTVEQDNPCPPCQ